MTDLNIYSKEQTDNLLADKASTTALNNGLAGKQNTLVSGSNIKTVNGNSLLGSGNITIGGSSDVTVANIVDFGWGSIFAQYHSGFDSTKVGIAYEIDGTEYVDTIRDITATFITDNGVKTISTINADSPDSGLTVTELSAAFNSASITSAIISSTDVLRLYVTTNRIISGGRIKINGVLSVIGRAAGSDARTNCELNIEQKIVL